MMMIHKKNEHPNEQKLKGKTNFVSSVETQEKPKQNKTDDDDL